jgi:hypothetical protein
MVISVTGAHFTHVSCMGQVDQEGDGVFDREVSLWGNDLSNEVALFRTSDGGMARTVEFRRVGLPQGNGNRLSLYGTKASFEEQFFAKYWVDKDDPEKRIDLRDALACKPVPVPAAEGAGLHDALKEDFFAGVSSVHPVQRLPKEFAGLRNGHQGSHQFLACDFIEACVNGTLPPNNVWTAARYCVPGIIAHESAKRGGELLEIPDFGDPPASPRRDLER